MPRGPQRAPVAMVVKKDDGASFPLACKLCPAVFYKTWLLDKHLHAKQVPRWPKGDALLCPVPECPRYFDHGLLLSRHLQEDHDGRRGVGPPPEEALYQCAVVVHNLCSTVEARYARSQGPTTKGALGGSRGCVLQGVGTTCLETTSAAEPVFTCAVCRKASHVKCGKLEYQNDGNVICRSCQLLQSTQRRVPKRTHEQVRCFFA